MKWPPLIIPNAFAALTLEKTNQLAFAAIEHGLSEHEEGHCRRDSGVAYLASVGTVTVLWYQSLATPSPRRKINT
jgi:hypothetical protein